MLRSVMTPPTNTTPDRIGRIDWVIALAVSVLAILARLRFLLTSPDRGWPHSAWFQGDATLWPDWAAALAQGQEFEHGVAIHSPAAAYVLHWMGYGVGASNFVAAKVVWCVVSALACGATYLAARMEVGKRAAGIAGALVAFSFSQYL